MKRFSWARTFAVFLKELRQMRRDRLTFAMAVGVPILQLLLFGYAINTDPKGLPTTVVAYDQGPLARTLVAALQNTGYFRITHQSADEHAAVMRSVAEVRERVAQGDIAVGRSLAQELARWFPGHADYLDSALAAWMCKRQFGGKPVVLQRKKAA